MHLTTVPLPAASVSAKLQTMTTTDGRQSWYIAHIFGILPT